MTWQPGKTPDNLVKVLKEEVDKINTEKEILFVDCSKITGKENEEIQKGLIPLIHKSDGNKEKFFDLLNNNINNNNNNLKIIIIIIIIIMIIII